MREIAAVDTRVPFIGRAIEIQPVLETLRSGGALTLVGPGGVGKSRLAFEAAQRFEQESSRRTVFVRLAGIDPEAVTGAIMQSLGIQDEPARSPIKTLREMLGDSPVSLILDNCEHAPDETSALIDAIAGIPGVAVLATSQRRLDSIDEAVLEVEPFSHEDAVAFFLARARLDSGQVDDRTVAIISRIVENLDGLAVAIDLAAARLASLSIAELAEQLNELRPYQLRSTRGSEPRHRTIGNVIAWSYAQLTEDAKRTFALSSLFTYEYDHEDIRALVGVDDATARALLDELADSSLIVRAEFGARMLAPIRAVASRILASTTNRKAIDESFANRMNAVAAEIWNDLHGGEPGAAMQRLFVRYADFCSVMAWALKRPQDRVAQILEVLTASMVLWADGGRFTEGLRWTERLESVAERLTPSTRGRIYYLGLVVAHAASDYRRIVEAGPKMISAFTISDEHLGLARAYNALATASLNTGQMDQAVTYVDTALRLYQQLDHERGIGAALVNRGLIHFEGNEDIPQSRTAFAQAFDILDRLGATTLAGVALGNLAEVEHVVREYDHSDELAKMAIDRFEVTSGLPSIAWQYQTMARNALARSRFPSAREYLQTASDLLRRSPQVLYLARLAELTAAVLAGADRDADAAFVAALGARLRRERSLPAVGFAVKETEATNRALRERATAETLDLSAARAAGADLTMLASTLSSMLRTAGEPERDRSERTPAKT